MKIEAIKQAMQKLSLRDSDLYNINATISSVMLQGDYNEEVAQCLRDQGIHLTRQLDTGYYTARTQIYVSHKNVIGATQFDDELFTVNITLT